jgi:uncharacterized protein (TIGR03067 family)
MKLQALLVVAVAGLLVAADAKDDLKKEKDKFKGTWSVIAIQLPGEGKGPAENELKEMKLIFTDDTVTVKFKDDAKLANYKLDPAKNPKEIDILPKDTDRAVKGIYVFEGETLKICSADKGDRPKEFKPDAPSRTSVLTLKRDKK